MRKTLSLALVLAMAAATPGFARSQHARQSRQPAASSAELGMAAAPTYGRWYDRRYPQTARPYVPGKIDSGYGPPRDWSEIEVSIGGNSN
jgi:hypothetical protein